MVWKTPLLAAVLLSGCTTLHLPAPDDSMSRECFVDGARVVADAPVSCANFALNLAHAREVLIEKGISTSEELGRATANIEVRVHDERCIVGGPGSCAFGMYWKSGRRGELGIIELNHDGIALAHELMHRLLDVRTGDLDTKHTGWNKNGFDSASDAYIEGALPIME